MKLSVDAEVSKDIYKMFLDIAKYILTGVILSTFFDIFTNMPSYVVYIVGFAIVFICLFVGLLFYKNYKSKTKKL